jgi:hypothetical protein
MERAIASFTLASLMLASLVLTLGACATSTSKPSIAAAPIAASTTALSTTAIAPGTTLDNPNIDMSGFLAVADEAARHREQRRVSEAQFIALSREPGTIILDARSAEKFRESHIDGAINLSFPDIAVSTLEQVLPDKNARILIYCNNNFVNAERAFPTKLPIASLNLSTYVALYTYGYRNVYELAPRLDPAHSALKFASGAN